MNKALNIIISIIYNLFIIGILIYVEFFCNQKYKVYVVLLLFSMIHGWFKYNTNKKSLLFYIGIVYITIPVLYWFFNSKYETIAISFVWLTFSYNIFAFLLFTITNDLLMKNNRNLLSKITKVISSFVISVCYLSYKTRTDNNFLVFQDDVFTVSFLLSGILLTSDFILTKIKVLLSDNAQYNHDYFKGMETTDNVLLTPSIIVKIMNNLLFISYIYTILKYTVEYLYN